MPARMHRYTALGSSFASGPGIPPMIDPIAGRSGANYPHLLAAALGLDLTDLTVSGATTATILDRPQATMIGRSYPPQLQGLRSDADLVTLTAGGNDLGYLGAMLLTAWNRVDPDGGFAEAVGPDFAHGIVEPTEATIAEAAAGLVEIARRVRLRAPGARVLLVDYLTIVGDETAPSDDIPLQPAELEAFRRIRAGLETAFVVAAEATGAELVRGSAISRGHALGSAEPWVNPFIPELRTTLGSFHPNAAGMAAVADELVRHLG
ncbi:MAG TPA: SGNH/GDSL hydrolase family protein [Microbacterium sp.]|uniref:SGNH/GDSL hydrolase family protein n=1 Tax=Microbacterium sp. TaxID=51671 RepID=UPI002B49CFE2|nr:SGNH/GDSL hydrolase family protein [Microbacterium sp.]HKT55265.1 SGNH/GDSL hydrolase family protein [Microbacterium sp.]